MATPEREAAIRHAYDHRYDNDPPAWSPSRAREALRARISACVRIHDSYKEVKAARAAGRKVPSPAQWLEREAEKEQAFDDRGQFVAFLDRHNVPIGYGGVHVDP